MTTIKNFTRRLLIEIEDRDAPGTFGFPCGANARDVQLTNSYGETTVLDCDNPLDAPPVIIRHLESQDTSVKLSGRVANDYFTHWRRWADMGDTLNIRIKLDEPVANGGGHWIVPAVLSLSLSMQGQETVAFEANISGAGKRVWTDASA